MVRNRRKIVIAVLAAAVVVATVAGGRHLLSSSAGSSAPRASAAVASGVSAPPAHGPLSASAPAPAPQSSGSLAPGTASAGKEVAPTSADPGTGRPTTATGSGLPVVPAVAVTPLVVHTATLDLRVGRGKLESALASVTTMAGADGGYVDSSSVSGGTSRRSPVAGAIQVRVLDTDFQGAINQMTHLGTLEDQQVSGKDVTVQVAQNAASLIVLQDEVALLEKKLAETTDTGTFLKIENQLLPVQQQLQQLQAAQSVLENSATLATITVDLTAPGAPIVSTPPPAPKADAGATSWRYLRHNTLAVLDGLAVGVGWALPVLLLLALAGLIVVRVVRRRRVVTAA